MTTELGRAIRLWLLARTALATVILGLATSIFAPGDSHEFGRTSVTLLATVVCVIATSFAVATELQRGRSEVQVGPVLLVVDILSVSAAVSVTGGAASVLSVLYGAVVVASVTTIGARAAFIAGGLSIASYGAVALGIASGNIPPPADQPIEQYALAPQDLLFSVVSNITALLIVTALAHSLASRLRIADGALAASEQRQQQLAAMYESIVRSIGAGLLTVDPNGIVTSLNPAAALLLRVERDQAIGAPAQRFFPSLDSIASTSSTRMDETAARFDGTTFPAGYSVVGLDAAENAAGGRLVSFQDLTEIHRLERAAREAERLATLGRVAATLAHEIRNPLSSISGSVELVLEGSNLDDENAHLLALVVREVERLDDLVEAMLDVAKPRTPQLAPVELMSLMTSVSTMASAGLGDDIRVEVASDASSKLAVVGDAAMIRQIVWNLVKNAAQSTGAGARVEIDFGEADDGCAFIEVRDHGPGIVEADVDRIFDPFHTGRTRGVGLGLALVRQLAQLQGGSIMARNRVDGPGAIFRLQMPRLPPTSTPLPEVE